MTSLDSKKGKYNDSCFMKDFDNSKYTIQISDEDLNKYTEDQYKQNEAKMNQNLLCQISEQRCRTFFCSYSSCLKQSSDMSKCYKIYSLMSRCIEDERKKVIYEYITTGIQPMK